MWPAGSWCWGRRCQTTSPKTHCRLRQIMKGLRSHPHGRCVTFCPVELGGRWCLGAASQAANGGEGPRVCRPVAVTWSCWLPLCRGFSDVARHPLWRETFCCVNTVFHLDLPRPLVLSSMDLGTEEQPRHGLSPFPQRGRSQEPRPRAHTPPCAPERTVSEAAAGSPAAPSHVAETRRA